VTAAPAGHYSISNTAEKKHFLQGGTTLSDRNLYHQRTSVSTDSVEVVFAGWAQEEVQAHNQQNKQICTLLG